jgi:lipid-A-disaccharide synthase
VTRVLVSCGEASGDLLAGGVIRALRQIDPSIEVTGLGGEQCRAAGAQTRWDVRELSVMGIGEVLPRLRRILAIMSEIVAYARESRPDVALLVDAPDFNLRLARRLRKLGIRVVSYVSPTVWAWRQGRVKTIGRSVDALCCILPFEERWYRERGVQATFVGHPLLEHEPAPAAVAGLRSELLAGSTGPLLAVLPGSRRPEVERLLPPMLGAARLLAQRFPGLEVALPRASTIRRDMVDRLAAESGFAPRILEGRAREVLGAADAALVASGTATLEAALAEVPTVVAYRVSFLTELVFRLFVRTPFISLPNILAGEAILPEILQSAVTPAVLAERVTPLLQPGPERARMKERLAAVRASLGEPGASARVAAAVLGRQLEAPVASRSLPAAGAR